MRGLRGDAISGFCDQRRKRELSEPDGPWVRTGPTQARECSAMQGQRAALCLPLFVLFFLLEVRCPPGARRKGLYLVSAAKSWAKGAGCTAKPVLSPSAGHLRRQGLLKSPQQYP